MPMRRMKSTHSSEPTNVLDVLTTKERIPHNCGLPLKNFSMPRSAHNSAPHGDVLQRVMVRAKAEGQAARQCWMVALLRTFNDSSNNLVPAQRHMLTVLSKCACMSLTPGNPRRKTWPGDGLPPEIAGHTHV